MYKSLIYNLIPEYNTFRISWVQGKAQMVTAAQAAWRNRLQGGVPSKPVRQDGTGAKRTPEGSGPKHRGGMRPNLLFLPTFICMSFTWCGSFVSAQETASIVSFHKFQNDSLYLRWSPANAEDWQKNLKTGYVIQKFEANKLISESEPILHALVYNQPYFHEDAEQYNIVNSLHHMDQVEDAYVKETFPPEKFSAEEILISRLVLVNFYISSNFRLIEMAGLGATDTEIKNGIDYKFVIKSAVDPKLVSDTIRFNTQTYTPAPVVPLEAEWGNRQVKLRWNSRNFKPYYYAYVIERSVDGKPFESIEDDIIINPMDSSELDIYHYIEWPDYLDNNDDTIIYRLYAYDYFGHKSVKYAELNGQGSPGIGMSPVLDQSEQLNDNSVLLKWSIMSEFEDQVDSWRLYVGTGWDGPYAPDTSDISPQTRELRRNIPFDAAYFRIVAVDKSGKEHSSFPKLVMSYDTIAPEVPTELSYSVDTSGILKLKWRDNTEPDFLGYKVFSSYDSTKSFILRHEYFVDKPEFQDTLDLQTEKQYVYYKLISVDERNNRSAFSEMLKIRIPDKIAPTVPQIHEYLPGKEQIYLKWYASPSEDIHKQSLYRRAVDKEPGWKLIQEWTAADIAYEFLDLQVEAFVDYAYILNVTDSSGLVSDPSEPVILHAFPDHDAFPIELFLIEKLDEKTTRLVFEFPLQDLFRIDVYKNTMGKKPYLWRAIDKPANILLDTQLEKDTIYEYQIKVVFKDGTQSRFSEPKKSDK